MDITKESKKDVKVNKLLLIFLGAIILILLLVSVNLYNQVNNIDYCVTKDSVNDTVDLSIIEPSNVTEEEIVVESVQNITVEEIIEETVVDNFTEEVNVS